MLIFKVVLILFCFTLPIISKNVKIEQQKLSCISEKEIETNISNVVTFDEFKCGKSKNGEYSHEIELLDGTKHKEQGVIINGQFSIRGLFISKADPEVNLICQRLFITPSKFLFESFALRISFF